MRDFVLSRIVNGRQQITEHITLHSAAEEILWPYGHTYANVPPDMTRLDHRTFVALGRAMARRNGYTPMQSSQLYVTDGDQIDWMYGTQRIFSFTVEMYPSKAVDSSNQRFYPPESVLPARRGATGTPSCTSSSRPTARTAPLEWRLPTAGRSSTTSRSTGAGTSTRTGPTQPPEVRGPEATRRLMRSSWERRGVAREPS